MLFNMHFYMLCKMRAFCRLLWLFDSQLLTRLCVLAAQEKGVTLHVENISLLTSTADDLKARLLSMGKLIEGSMHMSRGFKSPQSNGFFSFQGNSHSATFVCKITSAVTFNPAQFLWIRFHHLHLHHHRFILCNCHPIRSSCVRISKSVSSSNSKIAY